MQKVGQLLRVLFRLLSPIYRLYAELFFIGFRTDLERTFGVIFVFSSIVLAGLLVPDLPNITPLVLILLVFGYFGAVAVMFVWYENELKRAKELNRSFNLQAALEAADDIEDNRNSPDDENNDSATDELLPHAYKLPDLKTEAGIAFVSATLILPLIFFRWDQISSHLSPPLDYFPANEFASSIDGLSYELAFWCIFIAAKFFDALPLGDLSQLIFPTLPANVISESAESQASILFFVYDILLLAIVIKIYEISSRSKELALGALSRGDPIPAVLFGPKLRRELLETIRNINVKENERETAVKALAHIGLLSPGGRIAKKTVDELQISYKNDLNLVGDKIRTKYKVRRAVIDNLAPFRDEPLREFFITVILNTQESARVHRAGINALVVIGSTQDREDQAIEALLKFASTAENTEKVRLHAADAVFLIGATMDEMGRANDTRQSLGKRRKKRREYKKREIRDDDKRCKLLSWLRRR